MFVEILPDNLLLLCPPPTHPPSIFQETSAVPEDSKERKQKCIALVSFSLRLFARLLICCARARTSARRREIWLIVPEQSFRYCALLDAIAASLQLCNSSVVLALRCLQSHCLYKSCGELFISLKVHWTACTFNIKCELSGSTHLPIRF